MSPKGPPSATLKGIYVMRYLLFAGGVAIAVGVVERSVTGKAPVLGLLAGLAAGLFLFRGQLEKLKGPPA